jgi:uncharacterized BrkB/YihY/UPF0761 family membrane protein
MALLDWILVAFGAAVALAGSWIQLHPERVVATRTGPRQNPDWQVDPTALWQIRLLGACFLCMGAFFALQMTIDLMRLPWWTGTLGGLVAAVAAVAGTHARVRRQQARRRRSIQQPPLRRKVLELR